MKVKTSELIGAALDWAVAKALGYDVSTDWCNPGDAKLRIGRQTKHGADKVYWCTGAEFSPSTDWRVGGPIIEQEGISVMRVHKDWSLPWCADTHEQSFVNAPTALVAAMRSFTALKLGDEVEIPF